MIVPATRWFEMREVKNKEASTPTTIVEQTWINCPPLPTNKFYD
jgi:hypothetical protein